MIKTLTKILLLAFIFAVCFLFSCEDDEALQLKPVASLKLDIKLEQSKLDFPDTFKAFFEIIVVDERGGNSQSIEKDSITFVKQLSGKHRSQGNIEIPIDKKIILNIRASFGEYNLFGRSDTLKISAGDNEVQNIKVYLSTGNIIIDNPVLVLLGSQAVMVSANIVDKGIGNLTEYGFVWNTTNVTSLEDNIGTDVNYSDHTGNFESIIRGLSLGTRYYVSAYAKNIDEIVYSNQFSFTTNTSTDTIVLLTDAATDIGAYTARITSSFVDAGSRTVLRKGFVWATYNNAEIANNQGISNEGSGANDFISTLRSLQGGTLYYVRAYAEIVEGDVFYGNEVSFTTILPTPPDMVEGFVEEVLMHTAKINVYIVGDGGLSITSKGVVYSQTPNPSLETNEGMTNEGAGIDEVNSELSGLVSGITYYARAYAANNMGVTYSDELSFVTLTIGDVGPGGGIIFYDDGVSGGMEVGGESTEMIMQWGCATSATGALSTAFGSGLANTIAIVNFHNNLSGYENNPTQCSPDNDGSVAALYCYEFFQNECDDWFLPSIAELLLIYNNLYLNGLGQFTDYFHYLSSTEVDANRAKAVDFMEGLDVNDAKDIEFLVRPVRKF
ncbi:MAG: hypothetical protein PHP52_04285 [Bacteroidales bacterium]|nr:hypothetical protein [Bacteroidales bacterium]MDD4216942.1 hypothetical protein [Bacteroidales bacterium]